MKILILKRDKLGDLLLTTPMLRILREALPKAEIHLLASSYNEWVVEGNPCVDHRWVYGRTRSGLRLHLGAAFAQLRLYLQLRWMRFDVAIAAGGDGSPRAMKRILYVGAKRTIGYADESRQSTRLTDALPPPTATHESMRIAKLLTPLGIEVPGHLPHPEFTPPAFALDFADQWIAKNRLKANKYVVFGLGARRIQKQPNAAQILRWSIAIKQKYGFDCVFIWTPGNTDNPLYPGDDAMAQPVLDARLAHLYPFRGAIKHAIGIVWRARLSIFPDSGLMHFAAASPGGVLGLFADTENTPSPAQWCPIGSRADFIDAPTAIAEIDDVLLMGKIEKLLAGRAA